MRALQAATDRHRAGLGSLLELEDTRRSALAAELENSGATVGFSHVPHLKPGRLITAEGRRRWVL